METDNNHVCTVFASALCNALAEALSETGSLPWQFAGLDEGKNLSSQEADSGESYLLSFGSPFNGKCLLLIRYAATSSGRKELREQKDDAGTLFAAVNTTVKSLKSALRADIRDMQIAVEKVEPHELQVEDGVHLGASLRNSEAQLSVQLTFDGALAKSLRQAGIQSLFVGSLVNVAPQTNLDLVMDVALNVTLRFGRRQLPLREIIDLANGSVLELDRQVDEPVELVLDGRVIARGEAVIIDGNYGMRVTQIVHRLLDN